MKHTDVYEYVKTIAKGKVTTYGRVAFALGQPRAAQAIGWALGALIDSPKGEYSPQEVPWWRVVNAQGYLSIRGHMLETKELQAELLRAEGVEVAADYTLDLTKYLL